MRPEGTGVGQDKKTAPTVPAKKIHGEAGVRFGPDLARAAAPCAICRWRAVNLEIHLCSSGVNSDLRECFIFIFITPYLWWDASVRALVGKDVWCEVLPTY